MENTLISTLMDALNLNQLIRIEIEFIEFKIKNIFVLVFLILFKKITL